jgi:hypothetical protein
VTGARERTLSANKGLLLVTMEPPAAMEEEFNDWYDTEHVPERAAIAGFETARRFVCVSGWPRYVAIYDLRALSVLDEPGYAAVSGERFSPWSKRVLNKVRGQYRVTADQIYPGNALTGDFARMLMLRIRDAPQSTEAAIVARVREAFEGRAETLQARVFRHRSAHAFDYLALVESSRPFGPTPFEPRAFGELARRLDVVNEYAPYWTRGQLHGVFPPSH